MANSNKITWALAIALVGSNAWWFYSTLNESVVGSYTADRLWNCENSLKQALAILPIAASEIAAKQNVLEAAAEAIPGTTIREENGKTSVGALALTFAYSGRIVAAESVSAPTFDRRYR